MNAGFTLIEFLVAVTILSMVLAALVGVVDAVSRAYDDQREKAELARGAVLAMHRITRYAKNAEAIVYPASGTVAVDSLVLVAGIDEDGDRRVNEDPKGDANGDGRPGIRDVDDDGDGLVDEDLYGRQPGESMYGFAEADMSEDDDEDGLVNEDPPTTVRFRCVEGVLFERIVDETGTETSVVDAVQVRRLTARNLALANGDQLLEVELVVGRSKPDSMSFITTFHPANLKKTLGTRTDG